MALNTSEILFNQIKALLPPGPLWNPAPDGDFEKLINGIAANEKDIFDFLISIQNFRNPELSPLIEELEKEFGIVSDTGLSDQTRRNAIAARKYNTTGNGSLDQLQEALDNAGFDLTVYANDPAVDPAGVTGGQILVNNLQQGDNTVYSDPSNDRDWPMVFFVGGTATTGGSGEITAIADVNIDFRRADELRSLIVRIKPQHSWVYLYVNFVNIEELDFGFDLEPDSLGFSDANNPDLGGTFISA